MIGNFPAVLNYHQLFLKLTRFICNELPVLPNHRSGSLGCRWGRPELREIRLRSVFCGSKKECNFKHS